MPFTGGWACYSVYETADGGYMSLAALEPQFWRAFCQVVQRPDWQGRQQDEDQACLAREIADLFRAQPREHWVTIFAAHDCCCEPVLALDEAFCHPQAAQRGLLRERRLATPLCQRSGHLADAPKLGEHTVELLGELGYSAAEVDRLRQNGVV
jgi:crotonobetainyl-CoA:carnitine CoA-transferase CaiB-like acyl-CoA transferase